MKFQFGKEQIFTSNRMSKYPFIAKIISRFFGYTNIGNYARFKVFKDIYPSFKLNNNSKILDLGCGYGEYSFALSRKLPNAEIHALDIDNNRISCLNQALEKAGNKNIKPYANRIEKLYQSNYDFIFSIDVFEHILPEEMPFEEVKRKLKPGGLFLVKIPNLKQRTILPQKYFEEHQEWLRDEHIGQVYDLESLKNRVSAEGFEIVSAKSTDGLCSRLAWEITYIAKKIGSICHLFILPLSKLLIHFDRILDNTKSGNAIHIIAQKPL
ncbi:class I SAM-dependent methyltransferase [Hyphobacterium sp. CCMP332]|nr:class I SAM-dependent methyltransferase [Hyphobacterium sp. CCMP332]